MVTYPRSFLLAGAGLLTLCALGVLAVMLAWPQPASAHISPTELHVGEGEAVTYTVHFDSNPVAFDDVECGTEGAGLVYVNRRGYLWRLTLPAQRTA